MVGEEAYNVSNSHQSLIDWCDDSLVLVSAKNCEKINSLIYIFKLTLCCCATYEQQKRIIHTFPELASEVELFYRDVFQAGISSPDGSKQLLKQHLLQCRVHTEQGNCARATAAFKFACSKWRDNLQRRLQGTAIITS